MNDVVIVKDIAILHPPKMWIPRTNWRSLGAQFQWTLINRPLDTDADAGYTACHGYASRVQHKHTEIQNPPLSPHTPRSIWLVELPILVWAPHAAVLGKMLNLIFRSAIVTRLRLGFRFGPRFAVIMQNVLPFPPLFLLISPGIVCIFRYLSIICNWQRPKSADFNCRQIQWLRL